MKHGFVTPIVAIKHKVHVFLTVLPCILQLPVWFPFEICSVYSFCIKTQSSTIQACFNTRVVFIWLIYPWLIVGFDFPFPIVLKMVGNLSNM